VLLSFDLWTPDSYRDRTFELADFSVRCQIRVPQTPSPAANTAGYYLFAEKLNNC
jgi:hypothetical protein